MKISVAALTLLMVGCSSNPASEFFDRLEFEPEQVGCIRVNGAISVGSNPLVNSDVNVSLVKKQGDPAPDC